MRRLYQGRYPILALAGLALVVISPPAMPSIDFSSLSEPIAKKDACANHPQPYQGIYARHTNYPNVAPLTLKSQAGSNYLVKINDAVSGRPIISIYVHGGSSFETRIPRGVYMLKYATGTYWCGDDELFGASTETSKAERIFHFDDDHGYTIELISRRNGNLRTKPISREAFWR